MPHTFSLVISMMYALGLGLFLLLIGGLALFIFSLQRKG